MTVGGFVLVILEESERAASSASSLSETGSLFGDVVLRSEDQRRQVSFPNSAINIFGSNTGSCSLRQWSTT
jgi:hypothetical protein